MTKRKGNPPRKRKGLTTPTAKPITFPAGAVSVADGLRMADRAHYFQSLDREIGNTLPFFFNGGPFMANQLKRVGKGGNHSDAVIQSPIIIDDDLNNIVLYYLHGERKTDSHRILSDEGETIRSARVCLEGNRVALEGDYLREILAARKVERRGDRLIAQILPNVPYAFQIAMFELITACFHVARLAVEGEP